MRVATWGVRGGLLTAPFWAAGWVAAGPVVGVTELLLAVGVGSVVAWRGAQGAEATAALVDSTLGLQGRVLTAFSVSAGASAMARLVHEDAGAAWGIGASDSLRGRWPWLAALAVVGLAAAAGTYHVQMPGGTEGVLALPKTAVAPTAAPTKPASVVASGGAPAERRARQDKSPAPSDVGTSDGPGGDRAPVVSSAAFTPAPPSGAALGLPGGAAAPGESGVDGVRAGVNGTTVGSAKVGLPDLPERYRPIILRYLGDRP